jgi:flagellar assembly factor FliW
VGDMTITTAKAEEAKPFEFPHGLYGFPQLKRYAVLDVAGGGDLFKQLVAVDQSTVGFTLVYPYAFFPDYAPDIPEEDLKEIGLESPEHALVMTIANVPTQFREATANLKAPLVFNLATGQGRQVILQDERYATRHRLFPA